jgi:hypothetical protein
MNAQAMYEQLVKLKEKLHKTRLNYAVRHANDEKVLHLYIIQRYLYTTYENMYYD